MTITNLRMRLKRLEAQMTDESSLVPHTSKWIAYWTDWMQRLLRGEDPPGHIPIDAYRAVIDGVVAVHPELSE